MDSSTVGLDVFNDDSFATLQPLALQLFSARCRILGDVNSLKNVVGQQGQHTAASAKVFLARQA